jgi:YVTN family beta-propeller protein
MPYRVGFLLVFLSCACVLPCNSQTLVTTIALPGSANGISVNSTTNRIYVALGTEVAVIDGTNNTVTDTVQVPQGASFIAANMVTGRVYAAGCLYGQGSATCTVTVIDGATNAVIATIPIKGSNGIGIQGITVNPVTNRVYVSDDMIYQVAAIDGNTNTVLTYIPTDRTEMLGLAVDFSTDQILGAPSGSAMVVINGSNNGVSRFKVGGGINQDVAANSLTNRGYITNNLGTTLGVVNLVDLKVIASVNVGTSPYGVCVDYLSNKIFVTASGSVVEVDGKTNTVTGSATNAGGSYLDVNPVTRLVYVSSGSQVNVVSE